MNDEELIYRLGMSLDPEDNARARWLIFLGRASWSRCRPDRKSGLDPRYFDVRYPDHPEDDDVDDSPPQEEQA